MSAPKKIRIKKAGSEGKKINQILEVVESYAKLDFNKKAPIENSNNNFNALAIGINMLGEELQSSTISLNEKDILLKEIHHRIKNNLQIISSLLRLQADQVQDKRLSVFFSDNVRRIKSMALVHETLYNSENLSKVNFSQYLRSLIDHIREAYHYTQKIDFVLKAEPHNLKIDVAIACGLIINELITNSIKYAFEKRNSGKIELLFTKIKQKKSKNIFKLVVRDNGAGLPANIDIYQSKSLGLQLVTMLTEQLDGSLSVESNKGTAFTIIFPG
ncbi:MAG: sensor histidine kinase [Bacteroidia bacterium]|nr:sensor histidine kinase [Bacteroidia bacterium]